MSVGGGDADDVGIVAVLLDAVPLANEEKKINVEHRMKIVFIHFLFSRGRTTHSSTKSTRLEKFSHRSIYTCRTNKRTNEQTNERANRRERRENEQIDTPSSITLKRSFTVQIINRKDSIKQIVDIHRFLSR